MARRIFEKQNELIRAIAQQVSNTIPDTWEKFYFHADIMMILVGECIFL